MRLIDASFADNTKMAYATGLNSFETFRNLYQMDSVWPPSIASITLFIAWLSLRGFSYNTARSYISAIAFNCKLRSTPDVSANYVVQKALEGLRRSGKARRTRLPITRELLQVIISTLPSICTNSYETHLFTAAYCLAFFGFLRISELTVVRNQQSSHVLNVSDVSFQDNNQFLLLHVRFSKTDQYGHGSRLKLGRTGASVCPVLSLLQYLHQRPAGPGPLFCHLNRAPLTRYQFTAVLKKCLNRFNINYKAYSSHSFRIGAATAAAMAGHPSELIKQAGRWKSEIFRTYIRPDLIISLPHLLTTEASSA